VIKLDEIHIEEVRGIRKLTLNPGCTNFAVHGPNGSGKSGVVDAVDFGLTGNISRLTGKGTGNLSVKTHGPHVDARDYPDASFVRLKVYIPSLDKTATIERKLNKPKEPVITPDDPKIRELLDTISQHSEITLSRREIIKYVLSEGSTRSKDVQALLKLDDIGKLRGTFKTAVNTLARDAKSAQTASDAAADELRRHLDADKLSKETILTAVNKRRTLLGLLELAELTKDTALNDGLKEPQDATPTFAKATALRDLKALNEHLGSDEAEKKVKSCLSELDAIQRDPAVFQELKRDINELVAHLRAKLEKAKAGKAAREALMTSSRQVVDHLQTLCELLRKASAAAEQVGTSEQSKVFTEWLAEVTVFSQKLEIFDGLLEVENQLQTEWQRRPDDADNVIATVHDAVDKRPDVSAQMEARDFLTIAQERLEKYSRTRRELEQKKQASPAAQKALKAYSSTVEKTLGGLYSQVESKLAQYYCFINHEDEADFKAKLEHKEATLDLNVDFYKRGLFPPAAYHSEGHQDGMGLCLYLALMQQLLQDDFTFSVLDDVVMSVDTQHRREVCNLLKNKFKDTQFILTTHDQPWHRQMQAQGLISPKSSVTFRGWTIDAGPLVAETQEVWEEIDRDLGKNDVPSGAAKLRRHLEYVARELAECLRAQVTFQGDGNYDLGSLFPSALARVPRYLKEALRAAQSWEDDDAKMRVEALKAEFELKRKAANVEQWAINPAVHYNEWANFSKEDFVPVVKAYKGLLSVLRCSRCETWLYVSPSKGTADVLRCDCTKMNFNLKKK
jgi:hypothetical protein